MAHEQSASQTTSTNGRTSVDTAARDLTFRKMFRDNETTWLLEEQYNAQDAVWRLDFLREGEQGRWMRQRYKYDVLRGVVFFMGESPIPDEQLRQLRRAGRRFTG